MTRPHWLVVLVLLGASLAQPVPRQTSVFSQSDSEATFPSSAFTGRDFPTGASSWVMTGWVNLDTAGNRVMMSLQDVGASDDTGTSVVTVASNMRVDGPNGPVTATGSNYMTDESDPVFVIARVGDTTAEITVFPYSSVGQDIPLASESATIDSKDPGASKEITFGNGAFATLQNWDGNITAVTLYIGEAEASDVEAMAENRHTPGGIPWDGGKFFFTPVEGVWTELLGDSPTEASSSTSLSYISLDQGITEIANANADGTVNGANTVTLNGNFFLCDTPDLVCNWGILIPEVAEWVSPTEVKCRAPNPQNNADSEEVTLSLADSTGKFGTPITLTLVRGFNIIDWINNNPILAATAIFVTVVSLFCVAACTCCKPPVTYSEIVEVDEEGLPKDVRETQDYRKSLRAMMSLSIRSDVFNLSMPLFESVAPALTSAQEDRAKAVGKKLFPLMMENDYALLQALVKNLHFDKGNPQPQVANVAESVVILMETRRQALPLLKILLAQEVEAAASPLTLFHKRPGESEAQGHAHNVVVQMINTYAKLISLDFIRKVLQKTVTSITGAPAPKNSDIRASIMSMASGASSTSLASIMEEDREGYGMQMQGEKLLRNLVARGNPPPQLREIAAVLNFEGVRKFGGSALVTQQLVGQAFFTRFLLTALINPVKYGLAAKEPSDTGQRDLILLAKTVQKLVNGQRFEGNEGYMAPLNEFLDDYSEMIQEYCMTFGTVPRDNRHLKARFPKHGPESAALNLHAMIVRHLPAMKKSKMPLPSNLEAVLNDLGKPQSSPGDALASMTNNTEINLPENVAGTLIPSIAAQPYTPRPPSMRKKLGGKKVNVTQGKVIVGGAPKRQPGAGARGSGAVKGGPADKAAKSNKKDGKPGRSASKASESKGGERKKSQPRKLSKARPANPPPGAASGPGTKARPDNPPPKS